MLLQVRVVRLRVHLGALPTDLHDLQTSLHLAPPQRLPPPVKPVLQRTRHLGQPGQHDRVGAQLQRVAEQVQDGVWAERPGGVLEVLPPALLQLVARAAASGGDSDNDHPELPEVLPHRVGRSEDSAPSPAALNSLRRPIPPL